jgi:DNA polymerase I-like protein with 3'-5' exonuclease and polymerase domains
MGYKEMIKDPVQVHNEIVWEVPKDDTLPFSEISK